MEEINLEIPTDDFPEIIGESSDILGFNENSDDLVGEKYVVFSLDRDSFAVSANYVAEVGRDIFFTPLPNVPNWFLGIANLRGEIVSVIDLRKFWDRKTPSPNKTKTIVLRSRKDEFSIIVVVDRLGEIATLNSSQIENLDKSEILNDHLTINNIDKKALHDGKKLFILNPNNLLNSSKLHTLHFG